MTDFGKKLAAILEGKFGVDGDFLAHLIPVFERLSELQPNAEQWEELLEGVAAAYHSSKRRELKSRDEIHLLASQIVSELKKMDESLKVLGVYVQRLRKTSSIAQEPRLLH